MSKCKKESEGPSRRRFNTICVFGGSNLGKDIEFMKAANDLGNALGARKISVVYGGGVSGLKGSVAGSALIKGSNVLGITLKDLVDRNTISFTLGTELKVSSMHERIGYMLYNAEAFIAVPGGLKTMEEIFMIASLSQLGLHRKPLGLLNINGFYDLLLSFLGEAVEHGFIPRAFWRTITFASTADQLIDQLQALAPEPILSTKQVDWHTNDSNKNKEQEVDSSMKEDPDTTLKL